MHTDLDQNLTNDQWNMLRALRPAAPSVKLNAYVLQQLSALGLVTLSDDAPLLTPKGRAVMLRGSPLLWDLAA
jgi:ribosomal protein S19E (S16A)